MEEILGIEALDFGLDIGEVLTPKSLVQQLQQQSKVRSTFNDWLQFIHKSVESRKNTSVRGMSPVPIIQDLE